MAPSDVRSKDINSHGINQITTLSLDAIKVRVKKYAKLLLMLTYASLAGAYLIYIVAILRALEPA